MKDTLLCFFRHGIAVDRGDPAYLDKDRPLTPEGETKTQGAARGLWRLNLPFNTVLTSPWLRAKQTAAILTEILELPDARELPELAGDRSAEELLGALSPFRGRCILLVGHEPLLSETAVTLLGGRWSMDLKKAGACAVEVDSLPPRRPAQLLWHLTSRQLRWIAP
jgi:phosphohistidine phosphatase